MIEAVPRLRRAGAWFLFLASLAPSLPAQSPPALAVHAQAGSVSLSISGDIGSPCTVQFTTNLNSDWVTLAQATLLSSPSLLPDPSPTNAQRFYRVAVVPPPNMSWIRAGTFLMGSPTNEADRSASETQHSVTFSRGFYLAQFLVTQTNYLSLLNTNPSYFTPANQFTANLARPVEQVSWFDASNYCAAYTIQEQAAGRLFPNWKYQLPTESQWEYACRAGTTNPFYYGNNLTSGMANFDGEYEYISGIGTTNNTNGIFLNQTTAVGGYQPNPAGLYDMAGNVWEWCQDWSGSYPTNSVIDPPGPTNGTARVFRGGALNSFGAECRSANRNQYNPNFGFDTVGFRMVFISQ